MLIDMQHSTSNQLNTSSVPLRTRHLRHPFPILFGLDVLYHARLQRDHVIFSSCLSPYVRKGQFVILVRNRLKKFPDNPVK